MQRLIAPLAPAGIMLRSLTSPVGGGRRGPRQATKNHNRILMTARCALAGKTRGAFGFAWTFLVTFWGNCEALIEAKKQL
jgi:hypothetical protein